MTTLHSTQARTTYPWSNDASNSTGHIVSHKTMSSQQELYTVHHKNWTTYWPPAKWRGVYVCLYVCMHVCMSDDNFRKPWCRKFIFAHAAYLHVLWVKFIYEDHRVKVKVTGAKKVKISCSYNVKLLWAITPVPIKHRAVMFACRMGFAGTADRMVQPRSLSCDRKWPCVTKCTRSRVVLP